jgi:hypothetical protein
LNKQGLRRKRVIGSTAMWAGVKGHLQSLMGTTALQATLKTARAGWGTHVTAETNLFAALLRAQFPDFASGSLPKFPATGIYVNRH